MKFASIFLIFTIAASSASALSLDGRIIGGEEGDITDFPYQLSLRIGGRHNCGASIIAPRYALTAAHCLEKRRADEVTLRGGSTFYANGGKVVEAAELFIHPHYNRYNDYDVGIIKTKSDLFGENMSPIHLPFNDGSIKTGSIGTVSGWGYIKNGTTVLPDKLRYVHLPIIDQELCNKVMEKYGGVRGMMFCAGAPGKDACQGDSGGPMVMDGVQIGVVSAGMDCGNPELYGIYTRLSQANVRSFIQNIAKV
ncbi:trypsin-1-like [Condylostylus longicornis]|uniref:trypsin-1-like n=1 Tax=Condylostylus longicornis TaxID=2530218 RepID=UPI00244DBD24|nr:trypsin-1-like [Condylostylus longicornis]